MVQNHYVSMAAYIWRLLCISKRNEITKFQDILQRGINAQLVQYMNYMTAQKMNSLFQFE
jgi:hypothetical protein